MAGEVKALSGVKGCVARGARGGEAPLVPCAVLATAARPEALGCDHVKQQRKADGPKGNKAQDHSGDPCAFALVVKPGFGAGKPPLGGG